MHRYSSNVRQATSVPAVVVLCMFALLIMWSGAAGDEHDTPGLRVGPDSMAEGDSSDVREVEEHLIDDARAAIEELNQHLLDAEPRVLLGAAGSGVLPKRDAGDSVQGKDSDQAGALRAEGRESRYVAYLEPIQQPYAVGYIERMGNIYCQEFDGDISASYGNYSWAIGVCMRAWAMWSVSSIPNNANIHNVRIENYIWPPGNADHRTQYRRLTIGPAGATCWEFWDSLSNSVYTEFLTGTWDGYRTHTLGGGANYYLEAALTSTDWFAVGITENGDNDGEAVIAGWTQGMPVLIVEYCLPLSPPPRPTVTPNPACAGTPVTVSWQAVSGATNYRVYRDGSQVCSTGGTSCTTPAPGSTGSYVYTVKAENACGSSGASPGRTLTVITVPPAPGQPTVTPNPVCVGQVLTVSWQEVPGATYYIVNVDGDPVWTGSATSYSITSLLPAGTYIVTVKACNECGCSGPSPGRMLTVITVPPAPPQPTVTPNPACAGTDVTVSWSSVSGATNYRVYRDGSQVCSTGGTSCTVTAPGSPGSYTCTVKAENTCGLSGASPGRTLTVVGPPSIISLTPDSGEPGVTIVTIIGENFWDDPQPGYAVVFTDNAEVPDSACAWTNNQIVLTVPYGALTGPVYVRACTESAPTPFGHWTPVGLVLVAATAPSPDEIHLEWYGESGAGSSYDIFRAEGGYSGEYHLVATVVPEGDGIQVYVDTDVEPSQTYCYMVSASGSGLSSASGPLCAETPAFRPESYALLGAAPNPFNPSTTVFFDVPDPGGRVELVLYDISGRKVATLCDGPRDPGRNSVYWGGMMDSGESAASGVYLCRMVAEDFETSCKITMLK